MLHFVAAEESKGENSQVSVHIDQIYEIEDLNAIKSRSVN